jgi:hypothetical protein
MADKDESTSDAVTIDTNPGNLFAPPPLSEPQILSTGLFLHSHQPFEFSHCLTLFGQIFKYLEKIYLNVIINILKEWLTKMNPHRMQ